MAKLRDIRPSFTVDTFKEQLTLDEQKFVLQNLTEFPSVVKSSLKLNPEDYLRCIYNGPVNVFGNCPIRTIFHEWATRVVEHPDQVDICQSAAYMEMIFKRFHPNPTSPLHNRSYDFMMNEDCYDINSYRILEGNMEDYLNRYLSIPFNSDMDRKSILIYATKFMAEKTKHLAEVNWIWLKLSPHIRGSKDGGFGYDVERVYNQEETKTASDFNQLLLHFMTATINMLKQPGMIECRQYAALICFADYKGYKSKRIRDMISYVHGTGTYEEVCDWIGHFNSIDAVAEFNDMKKEYMSI